MNEQLFHTNTFVFYKTMLNRTEPNSVFLKTISMYTYT